MATESYDVVVMGAGIHGAGVAQACAAAGYSVLLLEKTRIAAGTSSRSSKLIHGGLRYLEQGQLRLVRECLRERALLLHNAPELVRRVPFYLPVYNTTARRPLRIVAGLGLYALLGGGGFSRLSRRRWPDLDGLTTAGLQQVFRYWDAQTDDAALTRAVVASALQLGAVLRCPAEVQGIQLADPLSEVAYVWQGREHTCRARVLVNAAGPWANALLSLVQPSVLPQSVVLVQGSHLLLPAPLAHGVYYVEAPSDGRAVFVIPWRGQTLVGTTETPFHGDPAAVRPSAQERAYLLATLCHYFPRYAAVPANAVEAFAGLRVLPAGAGDAAARSRETVLAPDRPRRPRLLTIYGGKLTAYRATAAAVLQRLQPSLPGRKAVARTSHLVLVPAEEKQLLPP
jgi:glycerol-3-phosphate dehydrogenase